MGHVRWGMLCMNILLCAAIHAQKTWDGEAGDSLWHNPKNWFPDGVPLDTEHVLLDNSKQNGSYKILINGPDSIVIQSLIIHPHDTNTIVLEIAPASHLPIAMFILSTEKNIVLERNATLINHSGATSGNIFLLNGKIHIKNGGRYVHKTLRGNSYLVSKLQIDSASSKGIVEFDVPGNSGYTLSLSGRRFGTLQLSANESLKKSYSGGGSNPLTIEGDLIIGKHVSLTSSLVKNIDVKGDVMVDGMLSLNPASADSTGRSFLLSGEKSRIAVNGKIMTGNHFNQWIMGSKQNVLLTNLHIENGWIIQNSQTMLVLDTFYLKSSSGIKIHNSASLSTAHPEGISKDTSKGGLRAPILIMGDSLRLMYDGDRDQETGSGIPSSIASLSVNKKGTLFLSGSIEINDSLHLQQGICNTDSIRLPVFKGKSIRGNEYAFIDGPLSFVATDSGQMMIPIGKKMKYAPILLDVRKNETIKAEYMDTGYQTKETAMEFPVKSINGSEYWKLSCINIDSIHAFRRLVFFSTQKISLNNTYVVRLNGEMKWEMLPLISNNPIPYSIETRTNLKTSSYTTGWIQQVALASNRFQLSNDKRNGEMGITWKYDSNEHALQYIIEVSPDGNHFHPIDSLKAAPGISHTYHYLLKKQYANKTFVRVMAVHRNNAHRSSNILLIQHEMANQFLHLYPNPCQDQLFLESADEIQSAIWAVANNGRTIKLIYNKLGKTIRIDVSILSKGIYHLQMVSKGALRQIPFIKF